MKEGKPYKVCVIALAFGDGKNWYHGDSNLALSLEVEHWLESPAIQGAIVQWEIGDCLKNSSKVTGPIMRIYLPEGQTYMNSYKVLVAAKKLMDEHGYTEALLLAHPDHIDRVRWTAKNVGIKEWAVKISPLTIPYDPNSTQKHTRSQEAFLARERPTKVYLFFFFLWKKFQYFFRQLCS